MMYLIEEKWLKTIHIRIFDHVSLNQLLLIQIKL